MKVNTTRFGEIEIDGEKTIHFQHGLPGFEENHKFAIIPYDEKSPFVFLQSLDDADLAFLLTSPFTFFSEYTFEIDDDTVDELSLDREEDLLVYTLITLPGDDLQQMTANLLAPVVINQRSRQAKQIVLEKSQYKTKHRLFEEKKAAQTEGGR